MDRPSSPAACSTLETARLTIEPSWHCRGPRQVLRELLQGRPGVRQGPVQTEPVIQCRHFDAFRGDDGLPAYDDHGDPQLPRDGHAPRRRLSAKGPLLVLALPRDHEVRTP